MPLLELGVSPHVNTSINLAFFAPVNSTITQCQPCLWALCPSCALPASLQGSLSSNIHVMAVFITAGNEKCNFSQGTLQEKVIPRNWTFCSWRTLPTPVTTPAVKKWPSRGSTQKFLQLYHIWGTKNIPSTADVLLEGKPKWYGETGESMRKRLNVMVKVNAKLYRRSSLCWVWMVINWIANFATMA